MFDVYGDSSANLLEILAVVFVSSPISSARGMRCVDEFFFLTVLVTSTYLTEAIGAINSRRFHLKKKTSSAHLRQHVMAHS